MWRIKWWWTNIYKQTSTVIYNRLSVITDGNKSASSSYFESCLRLVNSPCFHTSMHFTGDSPFYALALCLNVYCNVLKIVFVSWSSLPDAVQSVCDFLSVLNSNSKQNRWFSQKLHWSIFYPLQNETEVSYIKFYDYNNHLVLFLSNKARVMANFKSATVVHNSE